MRCEFACLPCAYVTPLPSIILGGLKAAWEDPKNNFCVVNNDNFDGARQLETILA